MKPTLRQRGFTLIELMIVVVILGVLGTLALPSFRDYILAQRVRTAASDLHTSLIMARSEAMKTNSMVTITRTASLWRDGWTVARADGTTLITQDAYSQISISGPGSGTVQFAYTGRPVGGSVDASFTLFFDANTSGTYDSADLARVQGRCVKLMLSGMPETKTC